MKAILRLLVGFLFPLLFSSCYVYQRVNVASDAPQNDHSEFIVENDSLSVIYTFQGPGGSIGIDLFNKLDKPLYVDWRKSALIIGDESFTLWKDEASINGVSSSMEVMNEEGVAYAQGTIGGSLVKNDAISFIPPFSKIVVNSYTLNPPFFNLPKEQAEKISFFSKDGNELKGRKYTFTPDDSPYIFRIFLSVYTDDSFKTPFHFDNSFWVCDYITTTAEPQDFDIYFGNQFYNMKESKTANTLLYGALLGVLVLGGANAEAVDY